MIPMIPTEKLKVKQELNHKNNFFITIPKR